MFNNLRFSVNISILRICKFSQRVAQPLRSKKPKSTRRTVQHFSDIKHLRAIGGSGGDGCISFLSLWSNEYAGPDGGDGGHGGHVIFESTLDVKDLTYIPSILKAPHGEKGANKDCHGKNATHYVIKVPVGTIIKDSEGKVVGDLNNKGLMFIAARGGAGGKGNHFFITDTEQAPKICEYGAQGEDLEYIVEVKSMAHVGLIGFPNAGKSTLLQAISRARPKIAPYPFTTLKPHIGMVQYDDYEQIAVADLPGLIPDSHKDKGLGIQFLKHTERCMALLYVIDVSLDCPWEHLHTLQNELSQFSDSITEKPQLVIANKIDINDSEDNLRRLKENTDLPVIGISAKIGTNVKELLQEIRRIYDENSLDSNCDHSVLNEFDKGNKNSGR